MDWIRQPQECGGTYRFSGSFVITRRVDEEIPQIEILAIYQDVRQQVVEHDGIDYLVVYRNSSGQKLFFIDQLNAEMIASGEFKPKYNYCTLMFAEDY